MRSVFFLFLAIVTVVTGSVISHADDVPTIVPNRSRMLLYFGRNLSLTFSEFSDYWRGPHARLFLNTTVVKQNLLRYEQLHVNQEWKQKLRDRGLDVPEFDGILVAEAVTLDKILEAFNNPEYNEIVIPDTLKFANFSTALYAGFKITTVFDKLPRNPPLGVIRKDVQTLVVDTPKFLDVIRTTGANGVFSKYELNTLDPVKPTVDVPFPSLTEWDEVAMLSGPTLGKVVDELKNPKVIDFLRKDAPNFVEVSKGIDFVPCDVVSFNIPKS
ncbi:hypothetical protein PQX77_016163 [Marasmius sp. AFHP31]|nr:hypothetical protein PQX77_016163 [Marasmius sp. AFHP31]